MLSVLLAVATYTLTGTGREATAVTARDGLDERVLGSLSALCLAYDKCLTNLSKFRSGHMSLVQEYILAQQKQLASGDSIEKNAGGKGTGGTDLMHFLKPIRDNCNTSKVLINSNPNSSGSSSS